MDLRNRNYNVSAVKRLNKSSNYDSPSHTNVKRSSQYSKCAYSFSTKISNSDNERKLNVISACFNSSKSANWVRVRLAIGKLLFCTAALLEEYSQTSLIHCAVNNFAILIHLRSIIRQVISCT